MLSKFGLFCSDWIKGFAALFKIGNFVSLSLWSSCHILVGYQSRLCCYWSIWAYGLLLCGDLAMYISHPALCKPIYLLLHIQYTHQPFIWCSIQYFVYRSVNVYVYSTYYREILWFFQCFKFGKSLSIHLFVSCVVSESFQAQPAWFVTF